MFAAGLGLVPSVASSFRLRAMSDRMTLLWSSIARCCMSCRKRYCRSVSFQKWMMLYSVSLVAVRSKSRATFAARKRQQNHC